MQKSILSLLVCLFLTSLVASAQVDKEKIEKEREELQQEIKQIEGMYSKVKGETRQSINQLSLIKRKLDLQNKFLSNISKEIRFINDDLYLSNIEIYRLEKQLDTLKEQYAKSVVYTYKNRGTFNFLNFIFSANGFNDALKRIAYLRNYRAYREQQVANILETKRKIEQRKEEMIAKKNEKNDALANQSDQVKKLADTKNEQSQVVTKLKSQQKDIEKQLAAKRKRFKDLQNQIEAIVKREIKMAKDNADKKVAEEKKNNTTNSGPVVTAPAAKTESYLDLNATDIALNDDFEKNKGRLPWPVDKGSIKVRFGRYEYYLSENTKPLIDYNPGITIATPAGAAVKSIFKGEVASVTRLADEIVVVIRHGKYFTAYSNMTSASVTKGQIVQEGQVIGKAGIDDDGTGGKIDFMLMIESKNDNPETWLHK
ncbi:MAG: peptidoglycan DD-metalloendopeptidase family protein [Terrimonas sp.]|nr:peptidoglycan DD-metalloendopeptidase family protein [Terrimonas sp.]